MGEPVTFAPADPRMLQTAFNAASRTPLEKARKAQLIQNMLKDWRSGIRDRTQLRHLQVQFSNQQDAILNEGRKPFLLDVPDDLEYALAGAGALARHGKDAGLVAALTGIGLPPGVITFVGGKVFESFVEDANELIKLPFARDLIKGYRTTNAADAQADLTDKGVRSLNPAVADLALEINLDKTGVLGQVAADRFQTEAGGLASLDPSPAGVVKAQPQLFGGTGVSITVQTDNSAILEDIDGLRADVRQQLADLTDQVNGGMVDTATRLDKIIGIQHEILGKDGKIVDLLQIEIDAKRQAAIEQERAAAVASMRTLCDDTGRILNGVSAIARLIDPVLASEVSRVGGAVIQVAQTAIGLTDAVSALSKLSTLTAMGAAAATGDLIGAVMGLAGLFLPEQPSPELLMDQKILAAIGGVQQRVDELGQRMDAHFDAIDRQLRAIWLATADALGRIATTVNLTYDEVLQIRQDLVGQQVRLTQLQRSLNAYFQSAQRLDLYELIDAGLAYRERSGTPMSAQQFNTYAAGFHTWATVAAFDEVNQPVAGRPTDNQTLADQLGADGQEPPAWVDNASYVNRVLAAKQLPTITSALASGHKLPNIEVWHLAATAFAQLCAEWPELADRPGVREWAENISEIGRRYQAALALAGQQQDALPRLIEEYEHWSSRWGEALDLARDRFQRHELPHLLGLDPEAKLPGPVDVLGAPNQPIGHRPPLQPAAAGQVLASPDAVVQFIPTPMLLVDFLSASANTPPSPSPLRLSWALTQTRRLVYRVPDPDADPDKPHRKPQPVHITESSVDISLTWAGTVFARTALPLGEGAWTPEQLHMSWEQLVREQVVWQFSGVEGDLPWSAILADATSHALARLEWAQGQLAAYLAARSGPGGDPDLAEPATAVEGLRLLIEHYMRLVWPQPCVVDDILRAVLDGPPPPAGIRLPSRDDDVLIELVRPAADTSPDNGPSDSKTLQRRLEVLTAEPARLASQRMTAWSDAIRQELSANPVPLVNQATARLRLLPPLLDLQATLQSLSSSSPISVLRTTVHLTAGDNWDASAEATLDLVREAAFHSRRPDVPSLQRAIGTTPDGIWGPNSKSSLTATVKAIQTALGVAVDGVWGTATDAAFQALHSTAMGR